MEEFNKSTKVIALYLPQYYETEYNNRWWGKGYTEWVACKNAKPLFKGHDQPKVPKNNNYYDLSNKKSIKWQMDLAKENGIDGFAIYQYYSCGDKLLDTPLEIIRNDSSLDLPFFLFWANESWKKMWFGQDRTVVWRQEYGDKKDWKQHFLYCLSFFNDERYIKIDGKPVYTIYNAWDFQNINNFIDYWNFLARENGFPGIYFVKSLGIHDKQKLGKFSAIMTREPNFSFAFDENLFEKVLRIVKTRFIDLVNRKVLFPKKKGIVMLRVSYEKIWERLLSRREFSSNVLLGGFTGWDNSPRKSYNSIIIDGSTPEKFEYYFEKLFIKALSINSEMIIINAWNEWAEGAYLEPDEKFGNEYLKVIKKVKNKMEESDDYN